MPGPSVVVVGGGIVGASLADELTVRGWTNVTVVDAGPLPAAGGSSSHAPGVVFQTNGTKVMSDFARYTVAKFRSLTWQGGSCYLPVGGLEIATTTERAFELTRRFGYAQSWGISGARLLDARETVQVWDLLEPTTVHGGLLVPDDGIAKAVWAVAAQLRRAVARGATVLARHEVLDVTTEGGAEPGSARVSGVQVRSAAGESRIAADIVVCCAGIWGPIIAGMVDQPLALTPLAHQFAWSAPVAALADHRVEASRPVLRHQDASLYYRENYRGVGIGSYRHRPMPLEATELAHWSVAEAAGGQPCVLPFTADDFVFALAETARILPSLADVRLERAFNGIFSFTPDNMPLMGPHAGLDGFWTAESVWVTHSAGVAKAMAEWIMSGHSESFDLHGCDISRFERHELSPAYVLKKDCQNFVGVYDIVHPLQPVEHSRPLRTSPFYSRQQELGGVFLPAHGWERPQWYAANDHLVDGERNTGWHVPRPDTWAARFWSPTVAAEAAVTRTDVAIYDLTALKRLEVTGHGSTAFLQGLVTGHVGGSVGSVTYCLMLDVDGGIRSDVTVARLGPEHFQIGANGPLDLAWLRRHRSADARAYPSVQIRDITAGTCCLGIWGPRARDVVQPLTDADFSNSGFAYFRAKRCYLDTVEVTAMRLSPVGELGWELYTTADQGLVLWDLLMTAGGEHGMIAGGWGAFHSLRIEKGHRWFGADMTGEHTPAEAGLDFAVKLDKDFLGRDALLSRGERRRQLCLLTIGDRNGVVLGSEPVYFRDERKGYVTSAAFSYTLGVPLAYAWLPIELSAPGTRVEIGYFGERYPAIVTAEPAFDAEMTRIRC